jgi:(1->4)-alpha-D-glucan 1-alpha-D-glucosylmutase
MPTDWASFLARVTRLNRRFKRTLEDGRVVPDANEEYLLYQTILGAWPWQPSENFVGRIQEYMTKALSEAKINLSWINPDPAYVEAAHAFIADILALKSRFVETVNKFIDPLRMFGAVNSLAQTLLKMTIPGVPDIYQGMELWEFSLVDPDNRRPVNYDIRTRFLADLQERCAKGNLVTLCRDLLASLEDGRSKMWVIHRTLEFRGRNPALFRDGAYTPLRASGNKQEHVVAYQRSHEGKNVIVAVPRFAATLMRKETRLPLGAAWGDTVLCLPAGVPTSYRNTFTGERLNVSPQGLKLSSIFGEFPVAMLVSD